MVDKFIESESRYCEAIDILIDKIENPSKFVHYLIPEADDLIKNIDNFIKLKELETTTAPNAENLRYKRSLLLKAIELIQKK